jgi:hypothetical protein
VAPGHHRSHHRRHSKRSHHRRHQWSHYRRHNGPAPSSPPPVSAASPQPSAHTLGPRRQTRRPRRHARPALAHARTHAYTSTPGPHACPPASRCRPSSPTGEGAWRLTQKGKPGDGTPTPPVSICSARKFFQNIFLVNPGKQPPRSWDPRPKISNRFCGWKLGWSEQDHANPGSTQSSPSKCSLKCVCAFFKP